MLKINSTEIIFVQIYNIRFNLVYNVLKTKYKEWATIFTRMSLLKNIE